MRLTVLNESLHHGMQFKAISGGGEGTEFEKLKLEVKNNRAWEKFHHSYKKIRVDGIANLQSLQTYFRP